MAFELTFLGTSGGPLDYGNCLILIKPAHITYQEIIDSGHKCLLAIDAGLGLAALADLVVDCKGLARRQLALYADSLEVHEYGELEVTWPFAGLKSASSEASGKSPLHLLRRLSRSLAALFILHPHMDHILALVVNLPLFGPATHRFLVYGLEFTISALKKHIFNGIIWPDLPLLQLFDLLSVQENKPLSVADTYTVTPFEVTHGHISHEGRNAGCYPLLAFLVAENVSQSKILVFGDFELDTSSLASKNAAVWRSVAPYVLDGSLRCIVLECSTSIVESHTDLYGHLTPTHVIDELLTLLRVCRESGCETPLAGLHIIVTHVKDVYSDKDPRRKVLLELRHLSAAKGLRLRFSMALNGILVVI